MSNQMAQLQEATIKAQCKTLRCSTPNLHQDAKSAQTSTPAGGQ